MATAVINLEEFLDQAQATDARLEFDEGRVLEISSPSADHQIIVMSLAAALHRAVSAHAGEVVVSAGVGFQLAEDVARIPDALVTRRAVFASLEKRPGNYYLGAPELVIEIVSPTDAAGDIDRKIRQYLAAGAKSVWTVCYETRHVLAYREGSVVTNYEASDRIVEKVFDFDLAVPVADFFADLQRPRRRSARGSPRRPC